MKQKKKRPLALGFPKSKDWLIFSSDPHSVIGLGNRLERPLRSFEFDHIQDLGILRLGEKKREKKATLYFRKNPLVGLMVFGVQNGKSVKCLLDILGNFYQLSVNSTAGKTIAPTLFKTLSLRRKDLRAQKVLKGFCQKLKGSSPNDLWNLAIFAGFPKDLFSFAKYAIREKKPKLVDLKKEITLWYNKTPEGRKRAFIEKMERNSEEGW